MRYPIVEALTALMFAAAGGCYGPSACCWSSRLIFGCALIVLFAIDLEHHLLPNVITLPGIVVGFVFSLFTEPGWLASLIGIVGRRRHSVRDRPKPITALAAEEGLGMGDVKMLAMIGAFLGWQLTFVTLMLASLAGSIVGVALISLPARAA